MPEVLHDQNTEQTEERNPRPIGRFLLGLDNYEGENDPFEYAKEFAFRRGNFQKYRHKSLKVKNAREVTIDGRSVDLEFSIDKHAYIWKVIVAAERYETNHVSSGYVPHGGEQYELHCAQPNPRIKYYEKSVQGRAVRERESQSAAELRILQGLIEKILTEPDQ